MKKTPVLLILLIFLSACSGLKNDCVALKDIEKKSTEFLIAKADSISKIRNDAWEEKEELQKTGDEADIWFDNNVYFEQNCFTTTELDYAYFIVGTMIANENLRIKVIGNLDEYELSKNSDLSLKRAEFIRDILIKNGIRKNRIEILDAKNDRAAAQRTKDGNKRNRRAYFVEIKE